MTPRGRALAAVMVAATLFGTSGVARGLGPAGLSSVFVGSWRTVVGGTALVIAATLSGHPPWRAPAGAWSPTAAGWTLLGGAAAIGYQLAFFAAADRVGVGRAAVVTIGTGPVVAGLVDRVGFGVRIPRRWVAGVAVAVVGIVALSSASGGSTVATGWVFALAAGACYPLYGLAAQQLMGHETSGEPTRPLTAIATVFGCGALLAAPFAVASTVAERSHLGLGALAVVAWVGLAATGLAYALWAIGLRHLTLSDAVATTLAEPVAAVVLSAVLLDESLTSGNVVAMVVIVAGVVYATTRAQ